MIMQIHQAQKSWENYRDQELHGASLILNKLGFALDEVQVHISGERYLSAGRKLVLIGRRISDGRRVVIKASSDHEGAAEIRHEFKCRKILEKINFAYRVLLFPEEILFKQQGVYTIFITAFIEQECSFLERSLEEQFFLALKAFEVQEGVQATTYEHARVISKTFGAWNAKTYLKKFDADTTSIILFLPEDEKIKALLAKAREFLAKHSEIIDLYSDFLTHWDFVPHNFRIIGHEIYILDYSSMRFGNKYESWARFINFMTLYNPPLAEALLYYLRKNRTESESVSLQLMRIFRLTELIRHYANTLRNTLGDLHALNKKRIGFWAKALESVLYNKILDPGIIDEYKRIRDSLRDEAEKRRQEELH